ncbi:hypothetical protein FRC14_006388 [Serendipita sp. 396]|nr:hypothetical protein FRC14_006388 [Serendipita sp. 396]KAG8786913.1 hypothetical protein FRC15_010406 [Serendipita sp. 397]KAG8858061.1 hypothetical protein FRB91_010450 [Serendipita sp. 411]KAG8871645.1 hypothetical protein FRC20_010365 [Serendipita sp. 405]KAG9046587.1 hypothetical protein FS842_000841 [Serendipita sp. 407]
MELPAHDAGFQEAQKMFIDGWQKPQKPRVGRVFRIQMGEAAQEGRGKYQASAGDCFRIPVWYSAQCICDLGAPNKQLEFCSYKSCGICIPLTTAFTAFEFGQAVLRGNFGEGIYMTRDPSLADQFAISTTGSPFRVILLNSLVLPTRPARKGESVLSDNGDVFFKNPLAITPDYLICYQK